MMNERVRCSVCRHSELPAIDGLLTLGIPIRVIARNFGLTRSSVDRHKRHHLPTFEKAETARSVVRAEELLYPMLVNLRRSDITTFRGEATVAFRKAWDLFESTLDDSPENRLRYCLALACVWLSRVDGRIVWYGGYEFPSFDKRDLPEFRRAIAALEWWRDGMLEGETMFARKNTGT